jgi:4-hydroxybenzoyl-CoA thioesterase/acyl-CoA thioester hydrolase
MPEVFRTSRRVEFRDTDAAGMVHFSVFFNYMEEAEHELLRHLGLSVFLADGEGTLTWPRVAASCDFRSVLKFEEVFQIEVAIERLGAKSVTYAIRFVRGDEELANGKLTTVCCRLVQDGPPRSVDIPAWIHQKLAPYVSGQPKPH